MIIREPALRQPGKISESISDPFRDATAPGFNFHCNAMALQSPGSPRQRRTLGVRPDNIGTLKECDNRATDPPSNLSHAHRFAAFRHESSLDAVNRRASPVALLQSAVNLLSPTQGAPPMAATAGLWSGMPLACSQAPGRKFKTWVMTRPVPMACRRLRSRGSRPCCQSSRH